mmetsp:Transcript_33690/g.66290  ORF Transcript_33690/g.66290 Transcript_33690/m.66290 type:complete len:226 (-) Transcript_33690:49-726(-)
MSSSWGKVKLSRLRTPSCWLLLNISARISQQSLSAHMELPSCRVSKPFEAPTMTRSCFVFALLSMFSVTSRYFRPLFFHSISASCFPASSNPVPSISSDVSLKFDCKCFSRACKKSPPSGLLDRDRCEREELAKALARTTSPGSMPQNARLREARLSLAFSSAATARWVRELLILLPLMSRDCRVSQPLSSSRSGRALTLAACCCSATNGSIHTVKCASLDEART